MITIDGSHGEGGGQILRMAVALAAALGIEVEVTNVRAGRSKPGLQPQHLTSILAAAELCSAELTGVAIGSPRFTFSPQTKVAAGYYHFKIGTAGSTLLVAQTVLLPLALCSGPSKVTISGGTHVPHAPAFDYFKEVYLSALRLAGVHVEASLDAAGYYPRGGGNIQLQVEGIGSPFEAVHLTERGKLERLAAHITTSDLPSHVAERGAQTVLKAMKAVGRKIEVCPVDLPSPGPGAAVVISAECEGGLAGFTSLGVRGKPMEKVAAEPCQDFMEWWKSGAAVDEHLSDQLVLLASLSRGNSRWTAPVVTEHLRTALWLAERVAGVCHTITQTGQGTWLVEVRANETTHRPNS